MVRLGVILLLLLSIGKERGSGQSLMNIVTKDSSGQISILKDRLDPETNYLIESMAFWCVPCINSINRFQYHKQYWKERYNLEVILLEDEHYDHMDYVIAQTEEHGWTIPIFTTDDIFTSLGITSIPRYFLVKARSTKEVRISNIYNHDLIFQQFFESEMYPSILKNDFTQYIQNEDCTISMHTSFAKDSIDIDGFTYYDFDGLLLHEDSNGKNLYTYSGGNSPYLFFDYPLCAKRILTDADGDQIEVSIIDIAKTDSTRILTTDKYIESGCGIDSFPFQIIQGIGTNAGLNFDIKNGKIVSRLVCHQSNDSIIYTNESLAAYCHPSSTFSMSQIVEPLIFPNPIKYGQSITLRMPISGYWEVEWTNLDGQTISKEIFIGKTTRLRLPETIDQIAILSISSRQRIYHKIIIVSQ